MINRAQTQTSGAAEGFLRTGPEQEAARLYADLFDKNAEPTAVKLAHFAKYVRRQDMTRLLARYEIFKRVLDVKGSIVECGVFRGAGLMTWANFSAVLEPNNLTRRIYGFDSFEGFPEVGQKDRSDYRTARPGELQSDSYEELHELIRAYDMNRFLGHVEKVHLIKGDAVRTIPEFIERNPHVVVSLLFMDFDLYEPTRVALEHFLPRMPKGSVLAFDELDNPAWPGETLAALETVGLSKLELRRLEFDPYIAFAVLD